VDADADADAGVSGARRGALHGRLLLAGLGPPLLCAGVLAAALAGQITRLRAGGQLYFGGDRGFWSDTILSLADRLLYDAPALRGAAPIVGLAALLLVALTAGLYGLSVRKDPSIPRPPLALLLLLLCGLSSMGAHWLLGVKFLIERSALFLLPLLALAVAELLDGLLSTRRLRLVGLGLALTLPAALAWHAAGTLNLTHTLDWRYDADTARALAALGQQRPHPTVTLGAHWLHEPTLSFYRETLQLTWLAPITRRATLPPDADCLLLLPDAPPPPGYRFLRRFPLSRTTLLCR